MSRKHKEDVKKITWRHEESVPKSFIFNTKFNNFPPRCWNAKVGALGEPTWLGLGGQVGVKLRPSCLEVAPSRLLFLVSILNLAPSSRLRHLSIRSSFVDVSGLVSGLDSEPGSELPFAKHVDQIELRGGLRSRS